MYGQGAARNPSSMQGAGDRGDRSQPGRYPSRLRSVPSSAPPVRQDKPPEAKQQQQQPAAGDAAQQAWASFPQPPKQEEAKQEPKSSEAKQEPKSSEVKQEAKSSEAKQEEPPKAEPQSISSESKGRRIVPLKDGFPEEELQRHKSLQEEIKDDISNLTRRLAELHGQQKIVASGEPKEEAGVRVITLAGENRGANMDLASAFRKQEMGEIQRAYKLNEDRDSPGGESKGKSASEGNPVKAYVNSNVQGANNSILYNSSCPQRNPGVHLAISNNPLSAFRPARPDGKDPSKITSGALEMRKAVQAAPAADQLTVKRRCLRALFLESGSDSDPETASQKSIRHGCRYQCQRAMTNSN